MKSRSHEELESTLEGVDPSRRSFFKRLLMGAGAAILAALPDSTLLAQVPPADPDQGRGGSDGCGGGPGGGAGAGGGPGAGVVGGIGNRGIPSKYFAFLLKKKHRKKMFLFFF